MLGRRHQRPVEDVDEFGADKEVELTLRAEPEIAADVGVLGRSARAAEIFVVDRGWTHRPASAGQGAQAFGFSTCVVYGL